MMRSIATLILLNLCALPMLGFAANEKILAKGPEVFTGTLFHPHQKRYQLVRLFLFPASLGTQNGTSALLKIEFGVKRGAEYTAIFYPAVTQTDAQQILLAPDATLSQQTEVPTIVLNRVGEDLLTGYWFSAQIGEARQMELRRGWLPPSDVLTEFAVTPLQGFYEGSCAFEPDLQLKGIYLAPTRRKLAGSFNEVSSWNTLSYVGSTYCDYRGEGIRECGQLEGGVYNIFWGELLLTRDPHTWDCKRTGDDTLDCRTQHVQHCLLTRRESQTARLSETAVPDIDPFPSLRVPTPPSRPPQTVCQEWNGTFRGILNQGAGQLQPYAQMNWLAIPLQKDGKTLCGITGSAALVFGPDPDGKERHGFALPYLEFDPLSAARLVLSSPANDLIFNLVLDEGKIVGAVFSKRFGWMGTVSVSKDYVPTRPDNFVPVLTGSYSRQEVPSFSLVLDAEAGPSEDRVYDPISGLVITGWINLRVDGTDYTPGVVENALFDYFTNYLFIRTTNQIYVGETYRDGFGLRSLGRIFLGITDGFEPKLLFWKRHNGLVGHTTPSAN